MNGSIVRQIGSAAMEFEYRLELGPIEAVEADRILREVEGFERFDPAFGTCSNRRRSTGDMPDLDAKIEPTGIYVCDHGCGADTLESIRRAFARVGLAAIPYEL
jgi:hypothetical protein